MSRNLLTSAIDYLAQRDSVKIAHLVRLELANSTETEKVYAYLTDYMTNITVGGKVYQAGKITSVGDIRQTQGLTNYKLSITVAGEYQEELDRGLIENSNLSYVGNDIEVLRAYINEDGSIEPFDKTTNGPMQYFIGDITDLDISEGIISGNSRVTWKCAGKFSDFEKVNGRITDDTSHRGLVTDTNQFLQDGVTPNPTYGKVVGSDGAKKISHQTDRGFQHANQSLELITKYMATETKYKLKKRRFWKSDKLVEYTEEVEKTFELGVDLAAKYLPKVYGVRRVTGIPVFIDALKSDPTQVYIVYAFTEGEIEAFLNFYIDGKPVICSSTEEAFDEVCLGNQTRGDTISAFLDVGSAPEYSALDLARIRVAELNGEPSAYNNPILPRLPTVPVDTTIGTTHTIDVGGTNEQVDNFTIINKTGNKEITAFHGKSNQNACQELVDIAAAGNFLNQDAWVAKTGNPASEYWDADCRLLDTSYLVVKIAITEEETSIPELDAVISGSYVSTFDSLGNETPNQYSLNPVWQTLDYMLDTLCGGGIPLELIDLSSFYEVASILSNVTDSYDNDFVTYWRYLGWKNAPGTNVNGQGDDVQKELMQCNTIINTEESITKNLQALLKQFEGTLNILGGLYTLSIESDKPASADITVYDIKGSIRTVDTSNKNKWNSVQASIIDPAKGWQTSQVNFFNSQYLEQDNGIQKKGNLQFNFITNYYTAREWAQVQLSRSRYSRELSFTTYFKYLYLSPNDTVTLTYDRFGYDRKAFRVKSVTLKSNGLVDLVLEDYDATAYSNNEKSHDNSGEFTPSTSSVSPPTGLEFVPLPDPRFTIESASSQDTQGILVWDASPSPNVLRFEVRDWKDEFPDYHVMYNQVIDDNGTSKNYIFVSGLLDNKTYNFRVRTISKNGGGSKYSVVSYNTTIVPPPLTLPNVTNFIATNEALVKGTFNGPTLSVSWDLVLSPAAKSYELGMWDSTGTVLLGYDTVLSPVNTYDYTIDINKSYYANNNFGSLGAYREFTPKIRTTNNYPEGDPNRRTSEWVTIG